VILILGKSTGNQIIAPKESSVVTRRRHGRGWVALGQCARWRGGLRKGLGGLEAHPETSLNPANAPAACC